MQWIDGGTNFPTIEEWKAYFTNNMDPDFYIDDALSSNGIAIKWTDPNGDSWLSDTVNACASKDFSYTTMVHDSDETGNYMKFKAIFNCSLIKFDKSDTICLENGIVISSFRREQ